MNNQHPPPSPHQYNRLRIGMIIAGGVVIGLIIVVYWLFVSYTTQQPVKTDGRPFMELSDLLSRASIADDEGFRKALTPIIFNFPEDHLAHPDFRSEWWYFTGHLTDTHETRNTFGYQFTLFRQATAPHQADELQSNPWQTPQLYMAHFAITHIEQQSHRATEKFSRAGPGLAGTSAKPLAFWLEHWRLESEQVDQLFPIRLVATDREHHISLNLQLTPEKPITLQGDEGLSQKGPEPGNASYYYSYTRLNTTGNIGWDNQQIKVNGRSWFDHEWSTSALNSHQQGWDWFSLQLDNGYDLMYFRIRGSDKPNTTQAITLVDSVGHKIPVNLSNISLTELSYWTSPNGKRYPAKWRLSLPEHQMELTLTPSVADQEMRLSVNYWEGAITIEGSHQGRGFVELTGY